MYKVLYILFIVVYFLLVSPYGKSSHLLFVLLFLRRHKNNHSDVYFWRIWPVHFLSKMVTTRYMKEDLDGKVFISRQSRQFHFIANMKKLLFPISTLNWRVNNYVSRQGERLNRRNKSTIII